MDEDTPAIGEKDWISEMADIFRAQWPDKTETIDSWERSQTTLVTDFDERQEIASRKPLEPK
jgi:hypothetical protein